MGNRLKSSGTRPRRGRIGWIAALASLLYLFLASRVLLQDPLLELLESVPLKDRVGADTAGASPTSFEIRDRSFLLRQDQQGVAETDKSGKVLWSREFGALMTTPSISSTLSAWGLLDGSVQILDRDGALLHDLRPATKGVVSKYPCVYAVAVSENGESVAVLYGLDPQYFLVFVRKGDMYELAHRIEMKRQVRNAQAASFSASGSCVVARTADGLAYYDTVLERGQIIQPRNFSGELELRIEPIGADGFAFLAAKGDERFAGLIRRGSLEALFPVGKGSAGLSAEGDDIEIWDDRYIHRYGKAKR